MPDSFQSLEKALFRRLNNVVEPLVRSGVGSSRLTPASLIVLETEGFKSGLTRRTPVWSLGFGRYRLVATFRGERSFWMKNLHKRPEARYYIGGRARASDAIVIAPGFDNLDEWDLGAAFSGLANTLLQLVNRGWAFAVLVPAER